MHLTWRWNVITIVQLMSGNTTNVAFHELNFYILRILWKDYSERIC